MVPGTVAVVLPLNAEGAAKLAVNPAGEGPASRTCPVATEVIPDGGEGDLLPMLRSKRPSRQRASGVGSVRGLASQQAVAKEANR